MTNWCLFVALVSCMVDLLSSSNCKYWNGDLFMFAIPIDSCSKMEQFVTNSVSTKNSVSVSCIEIDNQQYIEYTTYENSSDCSETDGHLISTENIQCSDSTTDCNCGADATVTDCNIAIFTNYAEDEDSSSCDYSQYQQRQIIVDECIAVNHAHANNSYIVTCDEIDGLIYYVYDEPDCKGNIIETDYALHTKDDTCYNIQCPSADTDDDINIVTNNDLETDNDQDILTETGGDNDEQDEEGGIFRIHSIYCILVVILAIILQN